MPTPDDGLDVTPSGALRMTAAGTVYHLRRPTIGEMRRLEEDLRTIGADQRAELDAAKAEGRDPESFDGRIVGWVRDAVATLERDGKTLPDDDDDLPGWMLNPTLPSELRTLWRSTPWTAGANPTTRLTSAVQALQAQAARTD